MGDGGHFDDGTSNGLYKIINENFKKMKKIPNFSK